MYTKTVSMSLQRSGQTYKHIVVDTSRNRLYALCDHSTDKSSCTIEVVDLSSNVVVDEIVVVVVVIGS